MKLVTKAIEKLLPEIGSTSELEAHQIKVPLKIFNPSGAGSWFITEANVVTGEAFGYVTGLAEDELGYIDLNELATVKGRFGLGMERDIHWDPETTLAEVMEGTKR